jgi:glutaredoxin
VREDRLVFGSLAVLSLGFAGALAFKGLRGVWIALRDPGAAAAEASADAAEAQRTPVRVYTTSWCPHCARAKKWLSAQHVEYAELDVERDERAFRAHRRINPRGSVPTFDAYGEVVDGFDPVAWKAALERGAARR